MPHILDDYADTIIAYRNQIAQLQQQLQQAVDTNRKLHELKKELEAKLADLEAGKVASDVAGGKLKSVAG